MIIYAYAINDTNYRLDLCNHFQYPLNFTFQIILKISVIELYTFVQKTKQFVELIDF